MKTKLLLPILLLGNVASAELVMSNLFGDHMVLQADKPAKIWGQASPGAEVSATFTGNTVKAVADDQGKWSLHLPAMEASADGTELTISDGEKTLQIKDVLVGEVWFASGQSNMNWTMEKCDPDQEAIRVADFPGIRFFQNERIADSTPRTDTAGTWSVCTPETVGDYSAVGFFYARKLHEELGVPVAIIKSAWGAMPVESFATREALETAPEGRKALAKFDEQVAAYSEEAALKHYQEVILKRYERRLANWESRSPDERRGGRPGKPPMPPEPAKNPSNPTTIWNGMIHPFVGYTIRGVIWYQGESNAGNVERASDYGPLFALKIQDWRRQWGDDFRYLWVQLANYGRAVEEPGTNQPWAIVQEHQRLCLALPKTGMAVANDIGDPDDIHPLNKLDVGERLARWALADEYGKEGIIKSGPLYEDHRVMGASVIVKFTHIGEGLQSRDGGPLKHFEIKDQDGNWHWAQATIKDDTVTISHPEVQSAAAARYAWASNPEGANLVNSEGLPASLFTTE